MTVASVDQNGLSMNVQERKKMPKRQDSACSLVVVRVILGNVVNHSLEEKPGVEGKRVH